MRHEKIALSLYVRELPEGIHGISAPCGAAGSFVCIINEQDAPEEQTRSFIHEMLHIWHKDHNTSGTEDLEALERQRHAEAERLLEDLLQGN